MDFTSENTSPVHPMVVDAVVKANAGFPLNFAQEEQTAKAIQTIKRVFENDDLAAFPVITGTAANAVALGAMVRPYEAILCHTDAHIETDAAGAPAMYTAGARHIGVYGEHGTHDQKALARTLDHPPYGPVTAATP